MILKKLHEKSVTEYLEKQNSPLNKQKYNKKHFSFNSSKNLEIIHKKNTKNKISKNKIKIYSKKIVKKDKVKIEGNQIKKIEFNDYELNELNYEKALIYDKRSFTNIYWSSLKKKHLILFSFYPNNDFNSKTIKVCLFFLTVLIFLAINALFFNDSTMHEIYIDKGEYNIVYQLPQILYSTIISSLINLLIKYLSLTEKIFINIKNHKSKKIRKDIICLQIKLIIFFIISYILLFFIWYYLSCFCGVYKNTQIILLEDTFISFGLSLLYPFGLSLIPVIFRILALKNEAKDKKLLYKFSNIINLLI